MQTNLTDYALKEAGREKIDRDTDHVVLFHVNTTRNRLMIYFNFYSESGGH